MAYTLNKFDRSFLAAVEDGTIDRTTDLQFVGKNFAGYGEIQNENFLFLLENFASGSPPPKAIRGQLWFDTGQKKLKVYDNSIWKTIGTTQVSSSSPSGLQEGDGWWDSDNDQLYIYNGTSFELIGPEKAGSNTTRMVSALVQDTIGNDRAVIQAIVNGKVQFVISEFEFTLNAATPIEGFSTIKKGITLVDTDNSNGVTNPADTVIWGTASNSELLDGINSSQFLRSDQDTSLSGEFNFANDSTGLNWDSGNYTVKATASANKLEITTPASDNTVFTAGGSETLKISPSTGNLGLTYLGNTVWHSANHGSGSGLDADLLDGLNSTDFLRVNAKAVDSDLLDGLNSTQFVRSDQDSSVSGNFTAQSLLVNVGEGLEIKNGGVKTSLSGTTYNDTRIINLRDSNPTTDGALFITADGAATGDAVNELLHISVNSFEWKGNTIWHAGNDGSGSGLDADTLDGLNSTDFLEVDGKAIAAGTADLAIQANNADTVGGISQDAFFRKTGGAVSGFVTLHADPTNDFHAATKRYIDTVVGNIDPFWAGTTTFANVTATYANFPVNTRVSFWEERTYHRSANSNGGSVTISDRYRRTIKKVGANSWIDVGG